MSYEDPKNFLLQNKNGSSKIQLIILYFRNAVKETLIMGGNREIASPTESAIGRK